MNKRIIICYGIVGIIGTLVHLGVLIFLVEILSFKPLIASSIGFLITVLVSYYLNYSWTFKSRSKYLKSLFRYILVCCIGFFLNVLIIFLIVESLRLSYLIGQIISIFVIPVSNFLLNYRFVF